MDQKGESLDSKEFSAYRTRIDIPSDQFAIEVEQGELVRHGRMIAIYNINGAGNRSSKISRMYQACFKTYGQYPSVILL